MQNWKEFNAMKDAAWKTKTQDEYTKWQEEFKEWYHKQELTEWDKEQIKNQLEKINENKKTYFSKKQYVTQPKQSYIFREDEGRAFVRLANALADYIEKKLQD